MSNNSPDKPPEAPDKDVVQDVQVDSVHPRFRRRYYCPLCKQKFESSLNGLQEHFSTKFHKNTIHCGKCKADVFVYKDTNELLRHYHTCSCNERKENRDNKEKSNMEVSEQCVRKSRETCTSL